MSLVTPDGIRTLQRKLYAKAKQAPAYRFYALYDKLYRDDILRHAWRLVRSNAGRPGIDGVSFEAIEQGEGVEGFLQGIAQGRRVELIGGHASLPRDGRLARYGSINRAHHPHRNCASNATVPNRCGA